MGKRRQKFNRPIIWTALMIFSGIAHATGPDCSDINAWPTQLTANALKDFNIDRKTIDFVKTHTTLIISEVLSQKALQPVIDKNVAEGMKTGLLKNKHDLDTVYLNGPIYRQLYKVNFISNVGVKTSFITTTLASDDECSVGFENVMLIAKEVNY